MKWPNSLTLIRHGESAYNALKAIKEADPLYQEFKANYYDPDSDPEAVRVLAERVHESGLLKPKFSNQNTPLTERGWLQAEETGRKLSSLIDLPDVVFVSPYLRTRCTHEGLVKGWPELGGVTAIEDDRIREQEHGDSEMFGDSRIYFALNPLQRQRYELEGPYWYRYPGGKSVADVKDTFRLHLSMLTREYAGQNVLDVTHHLTKLATRSVLERIPDDEFIRIDNEEKPVNCGVTIYRGYPDLGKDGKLLLDLYNQQLY